MQDMKQLQEMGVITSNFMKELEEQANQSERLNLQQEFLQAKSGSVPENMRQAGKTKQPLNKNKKKRERKAQKQARKLQRA